MTYQSPPPPPPQSMDRLGSIKTYLLVAWIFALIFVIVWALIGIVYIILFAITLMVSIALAIGLLIVALPFLIFIVPGFLVFRRVARMRKAANNGDIATLKANSSVGWGIVALIFVGVIPGIMLLIADGPIKQL